MMIREVVQGELQNIKEELEEMKGMLREKIGGLSGGVERSYAGAVRKGLERKEESVIIVKLGRQQESETTKKLMKEKIDVRNMAIGITKLKKDNNKTVILGCDNEGEMEKLSYCERQDG
ncbi:hypothetical protein EAI_13420 [Harpegnathos saltator]|uniref:Uncharacterized protein n=1 Tax=Harpegnathos saltator TaxID=610380 RepID=E2BPX1_HARSA|nr:hypothetical protein EAI_13420 [Harpegnathos saltator]